MLIPRRRCLTSGETNQEIARYLANTYQIPLECDEKLNFVPVTSSLSGISLQNGLSAVCEEYQFRIRWKDGKSLVIEPQGNR